MVHHLGFEGQGTAAELAGTFGLTPLRRANLMRDLHSRDETIRRERLRLGLDCSDVDERRAAQLMCRSVAVRMLLGCAYGARVMERL
jgi:hypothetical protein